MGMYNTEVIKDFALKDFGKSRTKQAYKDEVDINKIIAKFEKTGMVDQLNEQTPFYGDVSDIKGYQEALNVVEEANVLFESMSPEIRDRFANDPQKMIDFLADEKNLNEAIELGMVLPKPVKEEVVTTDVKKPS